MLLQQNVHFCHVLLQNIINRVSMINLIVNITTNISEKLCCLLENELVLEPFTTNLLSIFSSFQSNASGRHDSFQVESLPFRDGGILMTRFQSLAHNLFTATIRTAETFYSNSVASALRLRDNLLHGRYCYQQVQIFNHTRVCELPQLG